MHLTDQLAPLRVLLLFLSVIRFFLYTFHFIQLSLVTLIFISNKWLYFAVRHHEGDFQLLSSSELHNFTQLYGTFNLLESYESINYTLLRYLISTKKFKSKWERQAIHLHKYVSL